MEPLNEGAIGGNINTVCLACLLYVVGIRLIRPGCCFDRMGVDALCSSRSSYSRRPFSRVPGMARSKPGENSSQSSQVRGRWMAFGYLFTVNSLQRKEERHG
jgi:hypothetical protein